MCHFYTMLAIQRHPSSVGYEDNMILGFVSIAKSIVICFASSVLPCSKALTYFALIAIRKCCLSLRLDTCHTATNDRALAFDLVSICNWRAERRFTVVFSH